MKTAIVTAVALGLIGFAGDSAGAGVVKKIEPLSKEAFVAKAVASCIAETKLHEKAAKDAKNEAVRGFAQKMAEDHKKTNDRLMEVARDMKLGVVQGFDKASKETYDRISGLSGEEFDRAYMQHVLKSHSDAVLFYEKQRPADAPEALRKLADDMLPVLRRHHEEAQKLAQQLKISG
jgi:putative membrane protein